MIHEFYYEVRAAKVCEHPAIGKLLLEDYLEDEPVISNYYELSQEDPKRDSLFKQSFLAFVLKLLEKGNTAYVAIDKAVLGEGSGRVVGCVILIREDCQNLASFAMKFGVPDLQSTFLDYVNFYSDLIEADDCCQIVTVQNKLQLAFLSVRVEDRGRMLACRLLKEAIKYAQSMKPNLIYGFFTTPESRKSAEILKMTTCQHVLVAESERPDGSLKYRHMNETLALDIMKVTENTYEYIQDL